ncbi:MAG: outer membrane protein assembly factor BamB [Rhodocyclaceae bacterium]|nr:outer membrane protein assembly factor BamB [Rhodocyclaceae bacterium]MCB1898483.1 outer membrane protein assembly factor BamB [Rhodocyclaceae bacterium]MCP5308841.1 outer membrane protein assembly factor BamB [Zoogloeaceae bacterium]
MRRPVIPMAIAAAVVLSACSSLNPFSRSADKLTPLTEFVQGAPLKVDWQVGLAAGPMTALQPAVSGDAVFAAGGDGGVVRIEGGRTVWRAEAGQPLSAGVGSDGRLAVVVGSSGEVIALDAVSGTVRWKVSVSAEVLAPPAIDSGVVVIRTSDNRLFGLAEEDGKRRWVYQRATPPLALRSYSGVLARDGVAVAGFPGGKMVAVKLSNGGALWELSVATPRGSTELERVADVVGTPVLYQRTLCAAAYQGRISCFDATNGNVLWTRDISSATGIDRDGSQLYVTDEKGAVLALDASNGASIWKQEKLAGRRTGRPLVMGNNVVVSDAEGYVHLLRREDGGLLARVATDGSQVRSDPVRLGSDAVVVQTVKGDVYAISSR